MATYKEEILNFVRVNGPFKCSCGCWWDYGYIDDRLLRTNKKEDCMPPCKQCNNKMVRVDK